MMFSHERHCGTRGGLGGRADYSRVHPKNSALLDPELGDTTALIFWLRNWGYRRCPMCRPGEKSMAVPGASTRMLGERRSWTCRCVICMSAPDASQAHVIDPGVSRNNSANFPSSVDATSEIAQYATPSSIQRYTLYIHQSRSGPALNRRAPMPVRPSGWSHACGDHTPASAPESRQQHRVVRRSTGNPRWRGHSATCVASMRRHPS
jgi:hypothetical protein